MATIEERAKAIAEKWEKDIIRGGEDISFTHLEYVAKQAATEQDTIARNEERERCIREAMYASCSRCYFYHKGECIHEELAGFENDCCKRMKRIRKAIEEGTQE